VETEIDLSAYDFALPPGSIAQHPPAKRDDARLLVLDRPSGRRSHARVADLSEWLSPGDLLIVNETRVLPARLRGHKATGGRAEALLLGPRAGSPGRYRALLRARGRVLAGQKLRFGPADVPLDAEVTAVGRDGEVDLAFAPDANPYEAGETPLPPYIHRDAPLAEDAERYQTIFAREPGAVAAPTAGLHLSRAGLARLAERGVTCAPVVLHVGPGTFRPLRAEDLVRGRLHPERYSLPAATAERIAQTRASGGRVVAVGTTSARVVETCARSDGRVCSGAGETDLFLRPGSQFRTVDALLTNFHLPRSSLLLLVAAFAGRDATLAAYADALSRGYRFYSYGDAMLIR
jgi:S-adenosylmethionine:tRNA ribosyltransferase-isomerase